MTSPGIEPTTFRLVVHASTSYATTCRFFFKPIVEISDDDSIRHVSLSKNMFSNNLMLGFSLKPNTYNALTMSENSTH
jgi:hypothetical protein